MSIPRAFGSQIPSLDSISNGKYVRRVNNSFVGDTPVGTPSYGVTSEAELIALLGVITYIIMELQLR